MIRVGVFGAGGRMGATVCQAVVRRPRPRAGRRRRPAPRRASTCASVGIRGGRSRSRRTPRRCSTRAPRWPSTSPWSTPPARTCAGAPTHGVHAVVGTTGLHRRRPRRARGARSRTSNCLIAPNFAIGAVLMMRFAELAAPFFETAEIIELHHDAKIDAPSGTAMATAERMAAASAEWAPDPTDQGGRRGRPGRRGPGGIHVHSVRLRGLVAHQEVLLGTTGPDAHDPPRLLRPIVVHARRAAGGASGRPTAPASPSASTPCSGSCRVAVSPDRPRSGCSRPRTTASPATGWARPRSRTS